MASQDPNPPVNLSEYEALARKRLSTMAYEYIAGGAADELTLKRNRDCFDDILLEPRVLRDVSRVDTSLHLFASRLESPILLAPTAYHKLVHPDGELATARGAAAARVPLLVSSFATTPIERIAESDGPLWFQLYVHPDRGFTRSLIERAEAAGSQALCITVDTPVVGTRDRDRRVNFRLPPDVELVHLDGLGDRDAKATHLTGSGIYTNILDPALTWETVSWIRSFAGTPVLLKGILSPEDARLAEQNGVDGMIVSNHGARNLDTTPSTIEALPRIVEVLDGETRVLIDGGVRRGTDVLKALALGAHAVLIGRPYLWALAVDGARGVENSVKLLRRELEAAMALCGRTDLSEIDAGLIWN